MSLVLDSSATLAWIYSDETTEPFRRLFKTVADNGAIVPALCDYRSPIALLSRCVEVA